MQSGGRISGRITITNDTGQALHIDGCGGLFQVLLTSRTYHPLPFWTLCLRVFTIPIGHWTEHVQINAAYNQCGQRQATAGRPKCTPKGQPALPPGRYTATVFERGSELPLPAPLAVLVTR